MKETASAFSISATKTAVSKGAAASVGILHPDRNRQSQWPGCNEIYQIYPVRVCSGESGRQLVCPYPGCMDKDKPCKTAFRGTAQRFSGNSFKCLIAGLSEGQIRLEMARG